MSDPQTVLHIAPTPFFSDRGCHIRVAGIVRSLETLGYANVVCTYHHGREVEGIETKRITAIANYTKTAAGPSKYKLLADWRLLWLTLRECRRTQPAVIHAHLHEGLMIGLIIKTLMFWKRIPLIADMQGSLFGELQAHGTFEKRPWLKRPVYLVEFVLLWMARTIICSSSHSLEKFTSDFKINSKKIFLVQDGAESLSPLSEKSIVKLKSELSIPENKCVVIYTGALLESKGLSRLKEVIYHARDRNDLHFIIIGYPSEEIEGFLFKNNLSEICTIIGRVPFEELGNFLNISDIAIDPKHYDSGEGSGKILNYLACGLPVLAFKTRNNIDFLPHGAELSISSSNMVELLKKWIENQVLREVVGCKNKQHFEENYSWAKARKQLYSVYKKLIIDEKSD